MKVLYNSRLLSYPFSFLQIDDRAFCYGDGLFETIVTGPNKLNLIDFHFERLHSGCKQLSIKMPFSSAHELSNAIDRVVKENNIKGIIRAKLQVWRKSGGLYAPEQYKSNFLLTVKREKTNKFYDKIESISNCENSHLSYSPISHLKTINSLPYVLAGIEKNNSSFSDLIIKNGNDEIAEAIASNIFWIKNSIVYTPSLKSGCIGGVMRRFLLEDFKFNKIEYQEVLAKSYDLLQAKSIFLTNASGIKWVHKYQNTTFENPKDFLSQSIKLQPLL